MTQIARNVTHFEDRFLHGTQHLIQRSFVTSSSVRASASFDSRHDHRI
jgi:hypothetical protein